MTDSTADLTRLHELCGHEIPAAWQALVGALKAESPRVADQWHQLTLRLALAHTLASAATLAALQERRGAGS